MQKRQNIIDNLCNETLAAKEVLKKKWCLGKLIGQSPCIKELHRQIEAISHYDVSVLVTGESGTGKELVSRAIHYLSARSSKPFIPINCGAIPENLFENELFGHVKGAFTDARLQQTGLLQEADKGTIFLDEIGSISPYIQVKFLRLLQDKEYKPLGDSKYHKADVRIIAATNKDLSALVRDGSFREDLFYRLDIVTIHIPPLRERTEDIPSLVEHFVDKYSREYNKPFKEVTESAMKAFVSYEWHGNVRELENKIQKIVVMSDSSLIGIKDVKLPVSNPIADKSCLEYFKVAKKRVVVDFEKTFLIGLLTEQRGDVASAARKAKLSRTVLWNLLKKHNITPKQFRG